MKIEQNICGSKSRDVIFLLQGAIKKLRVILRDSQCSYSFLVYLIVHIDNIDLPRTTYRIVCIEHIYTET